MFCPNCGASEQSPDAYCKKCGTYLRDVSFRGWLFSGNNPEKAARSIIISSVFIAILCMCISILILRTQRSGDLAYLKYAFTLCWLIIGYLVALSLVGFNLRRKMGRARSNSLNELAATNNSRGISPVLEQRTKRLPGTESAGEATTELLNSTPREFEERKEAR
jgi:hypothetical protein